MHRILIIDDEEKIRTLLSRILGLEGFEVMEAANCKAALKLLDKEGADVVLCDVKLPDCNGLEIIKKIKEKQADTEVIMLTAHGNIPDSVTAIKSGAFDYLTKGNDNNRIIPLIYRAIEKRKLTERVLNLEKRLEKSYSFDAILGSSDLITNAKDLARHVAETDTTVLLEGETGTGKEVFAQAIHQAGKRAAHQFVAINCAAFSRDLLEGEMFGHRAGAFTGATNNQKGLFEEANKGTIFLDEIGEMALGLQSKLLRVLESGEFIRIGDTKPTRVNLRVIAASNRDLKSEVEKGKFREDLYYRLSVFTITLPPLRTRREDIEVLALYFVKLFATKTNKRISGISTSALKALRAHEWKGNIRELKNVLERAVILCNTGKIDIAHLPEDLQLSPKSGSHEISAFSLAGAEKIHIRKVLNYTNGNKTKAAELLGIALTTLYRKLEEYQLNN